MSGPSGADANMAMDEALALCAERPVLRLYGWERPSVSIGCFQRIDRLDMDYLSSADIPFVRRITGGRGILHGREVTYSFSAPASGVFSGGLRDCYTILGEVFCRAFLSLGLSPDTSGEAIPSGRSSPICFEAFSVGEIKLGGRKAVGSAQKRWPGMFMQQGSIPLEIDYEGLSRVFMSDRVKASSHMIGLMEVAPSLTADCLRTAIVSAFEETFGMDFIISNPTPEEDSLAGQLVLKYRSQEWNLTRLKSAPVTSR